MIEGHAEHGDVVNTQCETYVLAMFWDGFDIVINPTSKKKCRFNEKSNRRSQRSGQSQKACQTLC